MQLDLRTRSDTCGGPVGRPIAIAHGHLERDREHHDVPRTRLGLLQS